MLAGRREPGDERDRKHDHEDAEGGEGHRDGIFDGHAPFNATSGVGSSRSAAIAVPRRPEPNLGERLDPPVAGGPLTHLAVDPHRLRCALEQRLELRQALTL